MLLLISFISVGCATVYAPIPYERLQHSYPASFNKTWDTVIEIINKDSLPIVVIDKTSGVIVTGFVRTGMWGITKKDSILEPEARFTLNIILRTVNANTTSIVINSHIERWMVEAWVDISGRDTMLQDKYFALLETALNK